MHLLIVILAYVAAAAIFFGLLYLAIRLAVRHALTDHYQDRGRLDAVAVKAAREGSAD